MNDEPHDLGTLGQRMARWFDQLPPASQRRLLTDPTQHLTGTMAELATSNGCGQPAAPASRTLMEAEISWLQPAQFLHRFQYADAAYRHGRDDGNLPIGELVALLKTKAHAAAHLRRHFPGHWAVTVMPQTNVTVITRRAATRATTTRPPRHALTFKHLPSLR